MTTIKVKSNLAYLSNRDTYTKGMVGKVIYISFDADWNNYTKAVVFTAGDRYKNVIITTEPDVTGYYAVTIPWEVMTVSGVMLRAGVYGSNSSGNKVIPTIWVDLGSIRDAADITYDIDNTPTFVQQIMGLVEQALTYRDETRESAREIEDMTVTGELLNSDQDISVTKSIIDGVVNLDFKIPRGLTGVSITDIVTEPSTVDDGYNIIYITMSNGTIYRSQVKNGSKGSPGDPGDPGVGIISIQHVSGDHSPGTSDVYRISLTDGSFFEFPVYNGYDSKLLTVNGILPDANGNIAITPQNLGLAQVASSGDYNDLLNTPTIPSKISDLDNDLHSITFKGKDGDTVYNGSENIEINYRSVNAVPQWRLINGYELSGNVTLTATDVGADPEGTAAGEVSSHNSNAEAHKSLFDAKADLVNGKIPYSEIPDISSYEEYPRFEDFPVSGDPHIFYVATNTSRLYRWIVSEGRYRETSYTLSLGTGHNTAFYGDWGKIAYDHAMITDGNPHGTTAQDLGLADVATSGDYNDLINKPESLLPYAVIPNPDSEEGSAGVSSRFARGDHSHPIVKEIVMGYFNKVDKKFYLHKNGSVYTDEITPDERWMYVDVDENIGYRWDGNKYVTVASKIYLSVEEHILNITV